ncbi:dihydrodipicolinate synthase family protein [Kribbella sp. NPDC026611]|uniref:dihydrodipicolinate synthase family protein n=1 Tax=Kribbella sp. NPDC026611 TaxID=3154911 RepID=UPI003409FF35
MSDFVSRLGSVCAVLVTPMDAEGTLDLDSLHRLVAATAASRAGTITLGGSVGEFLALTARERRAMLAVAVAAAGSTPVITAVGGPVRSAIEDAVDAAEKGAAAVMVHQPANPFASASGWLAYHQELADAVGPMPVVLYLRDPAIGASVLAELPANVVGVKHAVADPAVLAALTTALGERFVWLCGLAEKWAPFAWQAGATGFTSGLAQLDDTIPQQLLDALRAGDQAAVRRTWAAAARFEDLRARRGGAASVGVLKTALVAAGLIETATVRAPVGGLTQGEHELVGALLADTTWSPRAGSTGWPAGTTTGSSTTG